MCAGIQPLALWSPSFLSLVTAGVWGVCMGVNEKNVMQWAPGQFNCVHFLYNFCFTEA